MTKAVLISIQSQHAMNILNGDKTIELRKVVLNWIKKEVAKGTSVKFLMYVTKSLPYLGKDLLTIKKLGDELIDVDGYKLFENKYDFKNKYYSSTPVLNGKIVASFEVSKIEDIYLDLIDKSGYDEDYATWFETNTLYGDELSNLSCVNQDDMERYFINEKGYALHIDNLKEIEPMELSEVSIMHVREKNTYWRGIFEQYYKSVSKAPQNMMTVWYNERG